MKILVYRWKAYNYRDFISALEKAGHDLDVFCYDIADFDDDPDFFVLMEEYLNNEAYDMVMSINYFTVISNVCEKNKIPYISWNCDSMLISMYHQSIFHKCNYIFTFDLADVQKFRSMGVKHIFYLPLAADVERLDSVVSEKKVTGGSPGMAAGEIAFIGNLYDRNRYDKIEHVLPEYLRGYLEASLWAQFQISGGNLLQEMLTEEILLQLSDYFKLEKKQESFADLNLIFSSTVLGFKAANMEREIYLNALSLSHHVDLYTNSPISNFPHITNLGKADYWNEMPFIFYNSKINLNFTIPNIINGTPLRVWDILASGGFCLTTYREDLFRHFEQGKDLVVFEGKEDLLRKVDYYLEHEQERKQIAEDGYRKVKRCHTYDARLREMFHTLRECGILNAYQSKECRN